MIVYQFSKQEADLWADADRGENRPGYRYFTEYYALVAGRVIRRRGNT